jgi:hypothetical protein
MIQDGAGRSIGYDPRVLPNRTRTMLLSAIVGTCAGLTVFTSEHAREFETILTPQIAAAGGTATVH